MADKPRFEPRVIDFFDARLSFAQLHKAVARTGKDGKPKPGAKEKFSCEILLDPSRADHAEKILEIKKEAYRALVWRFGEDKNKWPKNAGGADLYYCFGLGNDLPKLGRKIYDGYADMWYCKLSDPSRPSLRNRANKVVTEGDAEVPYGGCYVNGKTTLYSYDNESKGVNANLRSLQFVKDGKGFGGGGRGAEDEYASLAGDAPGNVQVSADPFE